MTFTPTIISTVQTPVFDRFTGQATQVVRVKWMASDNHGPYVFDVPLAEYTPARVQQEQQKVLSTLQAIIR